MSRAHAYLRQLSDDIVRAQKPIRILKAVNWDPAVHARFFRRKERELPDPTYAPLGFGADEKINEFKEIRRRIRGRNAVEGALRAKCDEFIEVVRMLKVRGTRRFHEHSVKLYGEPRMSLRDSGVDNLEIANVWAGRALRPGAPEERALDASQAAKIIGDIVGPVLGDACRIKISRRLTADAAAGATSVAVRKDAKFSARQARALAYHEGLWHVLTSLNGYAQPVLTVLGVGLSQFSMSQEGGGIVAEYLSGSLAADRFRELGERAVIVDLSAQGADYLEVYRYLRHRWSPEKAAQMCERVFRGGVLTGGAPFTKDAIYQRGYCRVFNFLRHVVENGELDLLTAFLAGKMSLDDAPLIAALQAEGLVAPPKYVPDWAQDADILGGHVVHSLTMSRFDLATVSRYYAKLSDRHETGLLGWRGEMEAMQEPVVNADLPEE